MTERDLTVSQALNEALLEEMELDDSVLLIGEDIRGKGGLFAVNAGCLEKFGPDRVIDAPISEAAIAGFGVGAALVGSRPVVEVQVFDFITLMMDQLVNHAAKWRYMSGGQVSVPLVVRGPTFTGIGMAAQHSQSLEAWFAHIPGLVVVVPSTPYDAKGLLKSAIRENNPVVFMERRSSYGVKGSVPEEEYLIPLGQAEVKRSGTDISVITYGGGVFLAMQAARRMARQGVEVEVVDLRTLKPLDIDTVIRSVQRTGRVIVLCEAPITGSFASEVVARIVENCFSSLSCPPERIGAADVPVPVAAPLERAALPQLTDVVSTIERMMA
jgi:pyruvate/2-oxoglutarate/acetoin dehydrogenase E1 component